MKSKALTQNTAVDVCNVFTLPYDKGIPIDAERMLSIALDKIEQMSPDIRESTEINIFCNDRGYLQHPDGRVEILPAQMHFMAISTK